MNFRQKIILIFLSLALLFPSAISVSHIFAHEKTFAFHDFSSSHIHKKTIDCEICKIQKISTFYFVVHNYTLYQPYLVDNKFFNSYKFLSDYQKLPFELRGPPAAALVNNV